MMYRNCGEFMPDLNAGDRLDFMVDGFNAGTFDIGALPQNDATLLVVISRHDRSTNSIAFQSHVFADVDKPQVVVLDTYWGRGRSEIRIHHQDESLKGNLRRNESELLRVNSVVTVDPGEYDVSLLKKNRVSRSGTELFARSKQVYVVIRVGLDAEENEQAYAEQLMVFPPADAARRHQDVPPCP